MADLNTPAIAPPSATDLYEEEESFAQSSPPTLETPQAPTTAAPQYNPPDTGVNQDYTNQLQSFGEQTLANPSRWDADVVRQGVDLINTDIADQWENNSASMDEFNSSRGTVGSSIERAQRQEQALDLERERLRRMFDLNVQQANTYGQDRASAAGIGMQIGDFMRTQGLDADNQARYAAEFSRLTGRDANQDMNDAFQRELSAAQFGQGQFEFGQQFGLAGGAQALQERALQLQAQGMSQDEAFRRAQMEQQNSQFESSLTEEQKQFQAQLELQSRSQELQQLGMSQDEAFRYAQMEQQESQFETQVGQRSQELMQQAQLEGRSMDIEEARYQAELGIEGDRLTESARQFDLEINQQEAQRLAEYGMFTEGLTAEQGMALLDAETRKEIAAGNTSVSVEVAKINANAQALSDEMRERIATMDTEAQERIATAETAARENIAGLDNTTRENIANWANANAKKISDGEIDGRSALQTLIGGQDAAQRLWAANIASLDRTSRENIAGWENTNRITLAGMDNETRELLAGFGRDAEGNLIEVQGADERIAVLANKSREKIAGIDAASRELIAGMDKESRELALGFSRDKDGNLIEEQGTLDQRLAGMDLDTRKLLAGLQEDPNNPGSFSTAAERIANMDDTTRQAIAKLQVGWDEEAGTTRDERMLGADLKSRETIAGWVKAAQTSGDDKRTFAAIFDALARFAAASEGTADQLPDWLTTIMGKVPNGG